MKKDNPIYGNLTMKDYHVKGPLGMGFYAGDFSANYGATVNAWLAQGLTDGGESPSAEILTALSAFMTSLDASGLGPSGSRMKTMNIMHTGSKEFVKLNLKNVSTFKYVESGTVTFSEGNGCKSASSSYFEHPFKSDQYAGIETDLTEINYISESDTTSVNDIVAGCTPALSRFELLRPKSGVANGAYSHYDNALTVFTSANHKGLFIRTYAGGNKVVYRDGVKTSTAVTPTAPTVSQSRLVLAFNGNAGSGITATSHYTRFVALDALYDSFSDADELAFRNAFNTYKTAVSLP